MKKILIVLVLGAMFSYCHAQQAKEEEKEKD
jgi:hypothetical protein